MIFSLIQTKGGTGKSTLSQCLAFSRSMREEFESIALVEMDEQASLQRWWDARIEQNLNSQNVHFYHISTLDQSVIQSSLEEIIESHPLIIIDVAGESIARFHTTFACIVSDFILVPMRTSTHDEEAFEYNLLPAINKIISDSPEKKKRFYVIPVFIHPKTNPEKLMKYFTTVLPNHLHCLNAPFPFRTGYENFNRGGLNLHEYALSVKSNQQAYKQAVNMGNDIHKISQELIKIAKNF